MRFGVILQILNSLQEISKEAFQTSPDVRLLARGRIQLSTTCMKQCVNINTVSTQPRGPFRTVVLHLLLLLIMRRRLIQWGRRITRVPSNSESESLWCVWKQCQVTQWQPELNRQQSTCLVFSLVHVWALIQTNIINFAQPKFFFPLSFSLSPHIRFV